MFFSFSLLRGSRIHPTPFPRLGAHDPPILTPQTTPNRNEPRAAAAGSGHPACPPHPTPPPPPAPPEPQRPPRPRRRPRPPGLSSQPHPTPAPRLRQDKAPDMGK